MEMTVNLDLVKNEGVPTVCNSCLSQDRSLTTLNDNADLYIYLMADRGTSLSPDGVYVCWECAAILRKIRGFQLQAQYALVILQNMLLEEDLSPKPLSNLNKIKLENLNITMDSTENVSSDSIYNYHSEKCIDIRNETNISVTVIDNTLKLTDNKEVILKQMKEDYSDYDCSLDVDEHLNTANGPELKEEDYSDYDCSIDIDEHLHMANGPKLNVKAKPTKDNKINKSPTYFKFNKTAKITRNPDVDLNNYDLCFVTTQLTDSDIENKGRYIPTYKRMLKKRLSCAKCKKELDSALDLKRHNTFCHILKKKAPGPFKCLECQKTCPDQTSLRAHWVEHNTAMKCKLCNHLVTWKSNMKSHVEKHAYYWTCKLCSGLKVVYQSYKQFSHHYRTIHRRSICDYCGHWSKTKSALLNHISLKHVPPVCRICNKEFKNSYRLRRHTAATHPALLHRQVKPECTFCVECNKQFPSEAKYKLHLAGTVAHNPAVAARRTIVPCPDCGKEFTRKSYMNNHYRLFHQKETKHCCALCNKYLVSAWSLRKHIEGVHQKIREPKTKVCDLCGRAFTTNAVLAKHRRTHTGERPYKCSHCPAAFAQSSALHSHTRTQHKLQ